MHRKILFFAAFLLLLVAGAAQAGSYQYMSPEQVNAKLESKAPMHLVDIQVEDEFASHHIDGAMKTCAYPVKSADDKGKIDAVVADLQKDAAPVVIVCPRGKGGAERAYKHLMEKGIAEDRLFILEDGQAGWPYKDKLAQ